MNACELTASVTALANALACRLTDDELELLGVTLTQLGDTLLTIAAHRSICCPGSTIQNSRFTGTYRFRRDLRVENCTFELLAMWILEDGGVEGPLPGNLDFVGCTFLGAGGIDIGAYNYSTGRQFRDVGKQMTGFGFFGCDMGKNK